MRSLIKRLVPKRWLTWARARRRRVRHNVDVVVSDSAAGWLRRTPATYRVGSPPDGPPQDVHTVGEVTPEVERLVAAGGAEAAFAAHVAPRRRREPAVEAVGAALAAAVWAEIDGSADPMVALERVRSTGRRYALVPTGRSPRRTMRSDPISEPCVVVLAGVPLHDVGGGSRPAQLAIELAERGFHVVYAAAFDSDESIDLGLRFVHPRLEQSRLPGLDPELLARREKAEWPTVIAAIPTHQVLAAASALGRRGFRVVYDVIDDWSQPPLGTGWYHQLTETRLLAAADSIVTATPRLAARVADFGFTATIIPNGVRVSAFTRPSTSTPGLPEGSILGYHGSLRNHWLDWPALRRLTAAFPSSPLVMIGDVGDSPPEIDATFLGLKAHDELPGYLRRFSVGLIPYDGSAAARAASPLKAYEYLAAGVPVAAPPLEALQGLDGVYTDSDLVRATERAMQAPRPDPQAVLTSHSWEQRTEALLATIGVPLPAGERSEVHISTRPTVHYRDRRL